MTRENVELIEKIYEQDFLEWGYEFMSETMPVNFPGIFGRNRRIVKLQKQRDAATT